MSVQHRVARSTALHPPFPPPSGAPSAREVPLGGEGATRILLPPAFSRLVTVRNNHESAILPLTAIRPCDRPRPPATMPGRMDIEFPRSFPGLTTGAPSATSAAVMRHCNIPTKPPQLPPAVCQGNQQLDVEAPPPKFHLDTPLRRCRSPVLATTSISQPQLPLPPPSPPKPLQPQPQPQPQPPLAVRQGRKQLDVEAPPPKFHLDTPLRRCRSPVLAIASISQPQLPRSPPSPPKPLQPQPQPQPQPPPAVCQGRKQLDVEAPPPKFHLDTPLRRCRSPVLAATSISQPQLPRSLPSPPKPLQLQPQPQPPLAVRQGRKQLDVEAPPPNFHLETLFHRCRSPVLVTTSISQPQLLRPPPPPPKPLQLPLQPQPQTPLSVRQDRSQLVVATTSTRQPQFSPRPTPPPPTLQPQPQPALAVRQGLKQLDVEAPQTKHVRLDTPLRCCRSLFFATTLTQPLPPPLTLQPPPLTRRRQRKQIDVEAPPSHVQLGIPLRHCRSLVLTTTAARNRLPRPCCF